MKKGYLYEVTVGCTTGKSGRITYSFKTLLPKPTLSEAESIGLKWIEEKNEGVREDSSVFRRRPIVEKAVFIEEVFQPEESEKEG